MTEPAKVTASYVINAGGWAEGELDLDGLTPDQMAELIEQALDPEVSVCHQCAEHISAPEAEEMIGFSVNGVDYEKRDGHWTVAR